MSEVRSYRDLLIWQKGMQLAEDCWLMTRSYPKEELFGMTSQIRRSAASVPANIAEGYGRESRGEYIHFLRVSQGSLKELETHLILSARVGLCQETDTSALLSTSEEIGRMLRALIRKLQKGDSNSG
jgi:four helix bundle protein